ncbi:MAG: hypothetical protein WD356_05330 [Pseudomonadales bacterium]
MKPNQFPRYLARNFPADTILSEMREYLVKSDIKHDFFMGV